MQYSDNHNLSKIPAAGYFDCVFTGIIVASQNFMLFIRKGSLLITLRRFSFNFAIHNLEFMLTAVFSGIIISALLVPFGRFVMQRMPLAVSLLPALLFAYFCTFIPQISGGNPVMFHYEWIPTFGVDLNFLVDGLSLLFALMITGVGTLVFWYSSAYMKGHPELHKFYAYLSLFMAAMLGMVLSDNMIALFVFWELTSISSFFLIGFNSKDAGSKKSAIIALAITGLGGLLLLGAFVLLGVMGEHYSIQMLLNSGIDFTAETGYILLLLLLFGGAFTKSGQFPFHFWLPGAMKAPTPVSTYLHSATMVKAGIYILLRFTPLLGGHEFWNVTLIAVGGITMVYCAAHTLFRTDMKAVLAYSTLSALGIIVFLTGIGTDHALQAAVVFIAVHALYKAAMFLVTGIVDHETGTREIPQLGGLKKVLLPVAAAAMIAALSNAGVPPFFGFIGKDLIYESALHASFSAGLLTAASVLTKILLAYAGYVVMVKPFWGKLPAKYDNVHLPNAAMWLPPLILGAGSLLFGVAPFLIDDALIKPAFGALSRGEESSALKLFHGFNVVLLLSGITIVAGLILYFAIKPNASKKQFIARFEPVSPQYIINTLSEGFVLFARLWTRIVQNGYLRFYVITILLFFVVFVGFRLFTDVQLNVNWSDLYNITFYEASTVGVMLVAILMTVFTQSRLVAVASMGVVGYAMCLIFVFYSAPDLAMTQFAIDTLTVILFVLVLFRLPRYLPFSKPRARLRDGVLSLSFGALLTILALEVLTQPQNTELSEFYAKNAYLLAKGKNVVNVILVDFRGMDTLIEITVLAIAALGVFSLLKLRMKPSERKL